MARSCSYQELARRLGIHTKEETITILWGDYMDACLTTRPDIYNGMTLWGEISDYLYISSQSRDTAIRSPVNRLLHQLITSTIIYRHELTRVPSDDRFYMW